MNLSSTKISLYIHIPFCISKCKYCDFYSETINFERIPLVISEIINQLESRLSKYKYPEIETIFIGGGTPSLLPQKELEKLLIKVQSFAPKVKEWSIESNPESITKEFLDTCYKYGVTRLSIGIQSLNEKTLKILGRKANTTQVLKSLELVKDFWKGEFSLDLITSIPGQNIDMINQDIKKVISYNPDHISFYALSLEDDTVLEDEVSKGLVIELSDTDKEELWLEGRQILQNAGYINYEVSNYYKSKPCLHNINYWELKPYLGIGPGAVSTIVDHKGQILRISNKKSISEFLKGESNSWGEETELLGTKDFLEDYIIMGLRLKDGINLARFKNVFNINIDQVIPNYTELVSKGLMEISSTHLKLTKGGFDIMNSVLITLLDTITDNKIKKVTWSF